MLRNAKHTLGRKESDYAVAYGRHMEDFRIRELRKKRGLTQEALGALANIERAATVSDLERGKANPELRTLRLIADALEVTVPELFRISGPALERITQGAVENGDAIVVVDQDPDKAEAQRRLLDIVGKLPRTDAEKLADAADVMLQATLRQRSVLEAGPDKA